MYRGHPPTRNIATLKGDFREDLYNSVLPLRGFGSVTEMHPRTLTAFYTLAAASSAAFFEFGCDNCHDKAIYDVDEASLLADGLLSDGYGKYQSCGDYCRALARRKSSASYFESPSCYVSKRPDVQMASSASDASSNPILVAEAGQSDAAHADALAPDASIQATSSDAGFQAASTPVYVHCSGIVAVCRDSFSLGHGRIPEGFAPRMLSTWVSIARCEAAAAVAFHRMVQELVAFSAPCMLVEGAQNAAREEKQHAAHAYALAKERGASAHELSSIYEQKTAFESRSLLDFALENVSEGVVRESFGAMLNAHQATQASESSVCAFYTQITEDELGHAALSMRVHAWAMSQLSEADRTTVRAALRQAVATLQGQAREQVFDSDRTALGLPTQATQLQILSTLSASSWSRWAA